MLIADIYEVTSDNEEGALVASSIERFKLHYRPTTKVTCPPTPEGKGFGENCDVGGYLDTVTFKKFSPAAVLPERAIITITSAPGDSASDVVNVGTQSAYKTFEDGEFVPEAPLDEGKPLNRQRPAPRRRRSSGARSQEGMAGFQPVLQVLAKSVDATVPPSESRARRRPVRRASPARRPVFPFRPTLAVVSPGCEPAASRSRLPAADVERLRRELGVSGPLAQVLVRRGMAEPARAPRLPGRQRGALARSCSRASARRSSRSSAMSATGARITVHGDYDVDGVCSTAVLVRALRALGADVDFYLPDRAGDGYGLNVRPVRRLAARGTRLLVTVDCAITAVEEVAAARALGIEVVVTDHHAPRADGVLPQAPIVHPRLCGYPCAELCATAVAYKLAQALFDGAAATACRCRARPARAAPHAGGDLDLVALATIADVVPLTGENRTLVRRGLRALAAHAEAGSARADGGRGGRPGRRRTSARSASRSRRA